MKTMPMKTMPIKLVSKDAVIEMLYRSVHVDSQNRANVLEIVDKLERLPDVDMGDTARWEPIGQTTFVGVWMCSTCGALVDRKTNYCAQCGATMKGEERNGKT